MGVVTSTPSATQTVASCSTVAPTRSSAPMATTSSQTSSSTSCDHIGPQIREDWPKAKVRVMRRGLSVYFNDPVLGQDPYVDLVVALERKRARGSGSRNGRPADGMRPTLRVTPPS